MDTSYTYLRQFTPNVLAAIDFHGGPGTAELMQAVAMLTELNRTGAHKVPDSAPDGFVPTRFCDYLAKARQSGDDTAYRHYWELCVLLGLRDGLRSGDVQRDALTETGCGRIFEEKVSTHSTERPGLAAALDYLRPGDTLWVWKLDRLGRSVKDVLTIAEDLHERGIGLRILTGTLAGSYHPTGEGKFFFTMMAAFSELERHMIHQRTMAGLAAARAQGRTGGRPTVMDPDTLTAARARHANGESPTKIAKALGVSRASIYRHLPIQNHPELEQP